MSPAVPGRLTRAAIHCDAGELELRLGARGNWQLKLRADGERDWRLACSGDLSGGEVAPQPEPDMEPVRFGRLLLDPAARQVRIDDASLELRAREFELLTTLASQPERVFTKAELMRRIWGCEVLRSCRTLDTHASRLRNRLRRAGADGFVINCHGVGYKLWNRANLASVQGVRTAC
jgi:DNA-binding response OmpR family regulator